MNNTGIATFANDCVFTTPNPAQAKDSRVRNSINGFPVLMYINDELEGVYTFNLDRYSTNSLGYDTSVFPKCLSYEISANSDTGAGAFVPWSASTGKTEREYISSDFRCRYPDNRVNGDDDFAELKRLIDWVGNATDDMFREQIEEYFNLEYLIRYYLTVMCFGLVDNLGKNTMLTTFDGNIWYMQLYDCDSSTGLDNSGAMKFEPDIEVEPSVFNTSNSRLWEKLRINFPTQILAQWEALRLTFFTEENIMKYFNENISNKVPEINYNLDAWKKYITLGSEYLFACHGNRKQQITRWLRERLIYMDTLLGYTVSTNDYITVRANKLGEVYFDIQTFQPMYFSIKFRNEENGTGIIRKRIARGETVRFSYNLPVATDQEILIYGGRFIKDLGDLTNLNPTNLLLGNATRLTRVKCNNSDMLINASISNCTMLQEVDLRGCSKLGAGSDASLQTLDLTLCRNLRTVDIFGTQLTALYTSPVGGIIQEIIYPYSIQIVQVKNQARLTSLGIPCYYTGDINSSENIFAEKLSSVEVSNCPNVTTFVRNYCTDARGNEIPVPTFIGVSKGRIFNLSNTMSFLSKMDLSHCSNVESITLDNFNNLTEINFDDIARWDATSSNLHSLTLTNCPNVETLTFNQNTIDGDNSLGVAFKTGTALDLSGLYNLKHIRSNVGIKGLKKLILPLTIQSLVFDYPHDTTYSLGDSDIVDIFSKNSLHMGENDEFTGIDLLGIDTITDFSMGSLTKISNAINLNVKITNTFPYFNYFKTDNYFKPEGIVDISEYRGDLEYLFKGVDLDKLTVVCTEPLPHTSGKYMFAFASGQDVDRLNTLFSYMPSVTDFSYMFYNGYLKHAPLIPIRAENVEYMFYNNATMETTPSNWNQPYPSVPNSAYCYTGCSGIISIDGESGSIDDIPAAWGGFDRENLTYSGETITVDNTLEREIINFTASGQTLQNIVPEVGQTPTIVANKSEQKTGEGISELILIADGELPQAELEGLTLVNLASEKRSGFIGQVVHSQNIKTGLNPNFNIEDEQEVFSTVVEGNSLVNIIPEVGETTLLTNSDRSYSVEKGLDSNIIVKDGEMKQATVYGETMTNLTDKTVPTDETTVEYKQSYITGETINAPIVPKDGDYNSMLIEGNTLVNLLPETGSTSDIYVNSIGFVNELANDNEIICDGEVIEGYLEGNSTINLLGNCGQSQLIGGRYIESGKKYKVEDFLTGTGWHSKDGVPTTCSVKGHAQIPKDCKLKTYNYEVVYDEYAIAAAYKKVYDAGMKNVSAVADGGKFMCTGDGMYGLMGDIDVVMYELEPDVEYTFYYKGDDESIHYSASKSAGNVTWVVGDTEYKAPWTGNRQAYMFVFKSSTGQAKFLISPKKNCPVEMKILKGNLYADWGNDWYKHTYQENIVDFSSAGAMYGSRHLDLFTGKLYDDSADTYSFIDIQNKPYFYKNGYIELLNDTVGRPLFLTTTIPTENYFPTSTSKVRFTPNSLVEYTLTWEGTATEIYFYGKTYTENLTSPFYIKGFTATTKDYIAVKGDDVRNVMLFFGDKTNECNIRWTDSIEHVVNPEIRSNNQNFFRYPKEDFTSIKKRITVDYNSTNKEYKVTYDNHEGYTSIDLLSGTIFDTVGSNTVLNPSIIAIPKIGIYDRKYDGYIDNYRIYGSNNESIETKTYYSGLCLSFEVEGTLPNTTTTIEIVYEKDDAIYTLPSIGVTNTAQNGWESNGATMVAFVPYGGKNYVGRIRSVIFKAWDSGSTCEFYIRNIQLRWFNRGEDKHVSRSIHAPTVPKHTITTFDGVTLQSLPVAKDEINVKIGELTRRVKKVTVNMDNVTAMKRIKQNAYNGSEEFTWFALTDSGYNITDYVMTDSNINYDSYRLDLFSPQFRTVRDYALHWNAGNLRDEIKENIVFTTTIQDGFFIFATKTSNLTPNFGSTLNGIQDPLAQSDIEEVKRLFGDNKVFDIYYACTPYTEQVEITEVPQVFINGAIVADSDTYARPNFRFKAPSSNNYVAKQMKPNTQHTLRFDGSIKNLNLGGNTITPVTNNSIITSGSTNQTMSSDKWVDYIDGLTVVKGSISEDTGLNVTSNTEFRCDEYIPVKFGETYKMHQNIPTTANNLRRFIAAYDENLTHCGRIQNTFGGCLQNDILTITSEKYKYIRIHFAYIKDSNGNLNGDNMVFGFKKLASSSYSNPMLIEGDVRSQDVNYFTGVNSVIEPTINTYTYNLLHQTTREFDYSSTGWGTTFSSSMHNNVYTLENSKVGSNLQPRFGFFKGFKIDQVAPIPSNYLEDNPIFETGKTYTLSFDMHFTVKDSSAQDERGLFKLHFIKKDGVDTADFTPIGDFGANHLTPYSNTKSTIIMDNLSDDGWYEVKLHYYFTFTSNVDVYSIVWYAQYGGSYLFNMEVSNIQVTESTEELPYIIPLYKGVNDTQGIELRKLPNGVCDSYNPITGEYVQRVTYTDVNDYSTYLELETPVITYKEPKQPYALKNMVAKIETSTNTVYPKVTYSMQSKNVYDTTRWGIGRTLTQRNIAQMFLNGSTTPLIPTETMTFTKQQLSSGTIVLNSNGNDIVVVNEDYSGRDIPYFEGMRSVESLEISSKKDGVINSSVQIPKHIKLNGLPNGVRDSLDLKTGLLTRRVCELILDGTESWEKQSDSYWFTDTHTSYSLTGDSRTSNSIANPWDWGSSRVCISDGFKSLAPSTADMHSNIECIMLEKDEDSTPTVINIKISKDKLADDTVASFKAYLQENPLTILYQMRIPTEEKLILNTNNSCDYGLELPTGATDKYNVLTKAYTQNIKSILLNGSYAWDSMEELATTIKFCAINTSVGVADLNMKGSGGLYCDNNMFPNINDNSDVEHCRVDVEGNKFYIFINKDRLLSPDLVGFQIWMQENPFTMWYELNTPIMLTKEYNELDPSQARWSMIEAYRNGTLEYKSNSNDGFTLYPIMDYVTKSSNSFVAPMLKPDTSYTVYATNTIAGNKLNLGGREEPFSTANVYTSDNSKRITFNSCPNVANIIIVEGNTTLHHVPNFTGSINVSNPKVKIIGNNEIDMFNYTVESTTTPKIVLVNNKLTMTSSSKNDALVYETWLQTGASYTLSYNSNFLDVYAYDMYGTLIGSSTITDKSDEGATQQVKLSFVSPSTGYVKFKVTNGEAIGECNLNNLALRKGSSTVYESYKENTVSATCELRGIGTVKDKLDLSSTAYNITKVIKEIVLDGTENWNVLQEDANCYIGFTNIIDAKMGGAILCDQYATYKSINDLITNVNGIYMAEQQQYIYLSISKESLGKGTITIDRFKEYISKTRPVLRYELATPVTTTQPYTVTNSNSLVTNKVCAFSQGSIIVNSDSKLAPKLTYSLPSSNSFYLKNLKTGTRYTLKYPSASGTITIGNISYSVSRDSMIFTTPLTMTGDTTSVIFSDDNPQDVILLEGVYNTREVPLFSGIKSVANPIITVVNNSTGEETNFTSSEEVELRSLPNGLADKLDIVRGKVTKVVGYRKYQEGDENLSNVWTDGYNTAYALATPVVSNVVFSIPSVTSDSKIKLSSDYLIPQLNYRAKSSNNFPLDLLEGNTTYTLYADTLVSGKYSLGGVHGGIFTGTEVIALGDITNNLLTFEGDLGLSNVMLIKGNSINMTVPYFRGLKTVRNSTFYIEGHAGESNEHIMDSTVTLRSCACGAVKDQIDMKTGILTRNLSEVVLNGTESWTIISSLESVDSDYALFGLTKVGAKNSQVTAITCDRFNHNYLLGKSHAKECIYSIDNQIRLCVKQSTINGNTVNALKSWLNQNNTTVIYALSTPETYTLTSTWTTTPITSYDTQTTFRTEVVNSLKPMLSVTVATTTLEQTVSSLEAKNAALEEENLATMMALTEVYEMMYASMPESEEIGSTYSLRATNSEVVEKEIVVTGIGMIYAKLVKRGLKDIDVVPYFLREEVLYAISKGLV